MTSISVDQLFTNPILIAHHYSSWFCVSSAIPGDITKIIQHEWIVVMQALLLGALITLVVAQSAGPAPYSQAEKNALLAQHNAERAMLTDYL